MDISKLKEIANDEKVNWRYSFEIVKDSGVFTNGKIPFSFPKILEKFGLKKEFFKGKRVLEIGTADGAYAYYLEDIGADVVALDVMDPSGSGFDVAHKVRNSTVEFKLNSIYDICPKFFGEFDVVLYFGVFYHLKHPILALERLNSVLKKGGIMLGGGTLCENWFYNEDIENSINLSKFTSEKVPDAFTGDQVLRIHDLPISAFVETEFLNDTSNWWLPNERCVVAWFKRTGFKVNKIASGVSPSNVNSKVERTSTQFLVEKTADCEEEFTFARYIGENLIPSRLELIEKDREIEELKRKIEELESK